MKQELTYDENAHRFGRISLIVGTIATCVFPAMLIIGFHVPVDIRSILGGAGNILILMIPVSLSEFLSISPMIGTSAMYIMVLTGNFTNLKIPSSIAAMEAVGLDPANYTDESDVISTIAMGVSTIVCIAVIALGALLIVPLSGPLSNPVLSPAFENIVPALFGALGMGMMSKNFRLAIAPFILGVVLLAAGVIPGALVLPILILVGIVAARVMYKKNWVK